MRDDNPEDAFNDAAGLIDETIIGPYLFRGKIRVLGFAADSGKLEHFLKAYLNDQLEGSDFTFTLANEKAPLVYMLINDFKELTGVRKKGIYRNRSCQFHIPVYCTDTKAPSEEQPTRGTLQVFSYGSNMQNVLTSTEVRGPFMSHAGMNMKAWIEDLDGEAPEQTLFTVSPQVLGPDKEVVNQCLISLEKTEDEGDPGVSRVPATNTQVLQDIGTIFAFKQFQHAKWPEKACYQSLVKITHKVVETPDEAAETPDGSAKPSKEPVEKTDVQECLRWKNLEDSEKLKMLRARISRYEYHPIVDGLGLETESSDHEKITIAEATGSTPEETKKVAFDIVKPVSYLVIDSCVEKKPSISFYEPPGETLCYRWFKTKDDSGWKPGPASGEKSKNGK